MKVGDQIDNTTSQQVPLSLLRDRIAKRADRRATILGVANPAQLVRLSIHLPDQDRGLIRAIYHDGVALRTIAAARGQSERECRRTLGKLVRRLNSNEFALSVRVKLHPSRLGASVARACFVEGHTMRQVATRLGVNIHQVRVECLRIRAMAECLNRAQRRTPRAQPQREAA